MKLSFTLPKSGEEISLSAPTDADSFVCPSGQEAFKKGRVLAIDIESPEDINPELLDFVINNKIYDVLIFKLPLVGPNQAPEDYIDHTAGPLVQKIDESKVTAGQFCNYMFGIFQAPFYESFNEAPHRRYAAKPQYVCTANKALDPYRYATLTQTKVAFAALTPTDMAPIFPLPSIYNIAND